MKRRWKMSGIGLECDRCGHLFDISVVPDNSPIGCPACNMLSVEEHNDVVAMQQLFAIEESVIELLECDECSAPVRWDIHDKVWRHSTQPQEYFSEKQYHCAGRAGFPVPIKVKEA
jgi:hypothetical protein